MAVQPAYANKMRQLITDDYNKGEKTRSHFSDSLVHTAFYQTLGLLFIWQTKIVFWHSFDFFPCIPNWFFRNIYFYLQVKIAYINFLNHCYVDTEVEMKEIYTSNHMWKLFENFLVDICRVRLSGTEGQSGSVCVCACIWTFLRRHEENTHVISNCSYDMGSQIWLCLLPLAENRFYLLCVRKKGCFCFSFHPLWIDLWIIIWDILESHLKVFFSLTVSLLEGHRPELSSSDTFREGN